MHNQAPRHDMDPVPLRKSPTGIAGFDEITGGGVPSGRTTLLVGGPGAGKTIFALQILVNGARLHNEPGIFVAFEENPQQLRDNAATFGWDVASLERDRLFILDARISPATIRTGEFELVGLLAGIAAKAKAMNAQRIVFDALDVLLDLLRDETTRREELYRLHDWLLQQGLTGIITVKAGLNEADGAARYGIMQFMADTVVMLHHDLLERVALRQLRVLKYRGSSFADNEFPLVFGEYGIEVGGLGLTEKGYAVSTEKISSGMARLDIMLGGGYYRGSSVLLSGSPGTAKTTLAGLFASSCCARGEQVVYFCFDDGSAEIVRNLASVNIHLAPYLGQGLLHMYTALSETRNAEEHLLTMRRLIREHHVRVLVIDPISAMLKAGGNDVAIVAIQRLIRMTKSQGVTLILTSLLSSSDTLVEATPIQISTLADTWLHISYVIQNGERNRALTIVKSRGMHHSNQVREMLLSDEGVTLADVYTAEGQVLLGTARWQMEEANRLASERAELDSERRRLQLVAKQADAKARLEALRCEIEVQEAELKLMHQEHEANLKGRSELRRQLHERRSGDQFQEAVK